MNKIDLETIPTNDIAGLIRAYARIFVWSQRVPSMKSEKRRTQSIIQQLFEQLPEKVITHSTITNPVTGNWTSYPIIAKSIENDVIYYYTGELSVTCDNTNTIIIDPWEPKDPKVLNEYNKILQEMKLNYQQKQTGEFAVIQAEERLQGERKKYKSTFRRHNYLLVKYQIYKGEGKQFQHIPERFKIGNKPFWQVMEEIENTILVLDPDKYQTEEQKQAILTRFVAIEDMMQNLYYAIMHLFSYSKQYRSYDEQYNRTDNRNNDVSMQISIYSLKNADVAQECIRKQSFMYIQQNTNWTTSHVIREYANFGSVDLSRFHAIYDLTESHYQHQAISSLIMFYEIAKQKFDNDEIYLLRDFCIALGILKPEEEGQDNESN